MKLRQLIIMVCALITSASFFLPWVTMDPDFTTFASSTASYTGMTLIKGIGYGVQMLSAFGTAYGFPYPAELLYFGYILLLMPLLGIVGVILMGMRHQLGINLIRIQSIFTLVFFSIIGIGILVMPDLRDLMNNVLDIGFGLIIMNIAALLSFVYSLMKSS